MGGSHNKPYQAALLDVGREPSLSLKVELAGTKCWVRTWKGESGAKSLDHTAGLA